MATDKELETLRDRAEIVRQFSIFVESDVELARSSQSFFIPLGPEMNTGHMEFLAQHFGRLYEFEFVDALLPFANAGVSVRVRQAA